MADVRLFLVFFIVWLYRRSVARQRSLRSSESARRARILRFNRLQSEQVAYFMQFLFARRTLAAHTRRLLWTKTRNRTFLNDMASSWTDREWKQNFRVNKATFSLLCRELRGRLTRQSTVRDPLSVEQRVAISLWRLGTNVEYRTISHLFGVGISTVCVVLHDFCQSVVDVMGLRYLSLPSEDKLRAIRDGFRTKWGFPQCIGAIDGTHIPIIAPKEHPLDYYNRKGYHSLLMQALVDDEYRFLNVNTGWPGSVHDARMLSNSKLFQKCEAGTFLPRWEESLGTTTVPLLILGDPAYPLRPWLMKPFSDTGLTPRQRKFNYQLSRSRVVVENAFGRLKGRWRTLMKRIDNDIKYVPTLVMACCVLHNLCELHGDQCEDDWLVETSSSNASAIASSTATSTLTSGQQNAVTIREALCDYFESH